MMTSVWRYSHFALAVSSFLFLAIASLTGIILAFEPIMEKTTGLKARGFDTLTVADVVPLVKEKVKGVQEIAVDDNDFVIAKISAAKGDTKVYINPVTGAMLDTVPAKRPVFQWATDLHRSLFLHETGRLIVGITAFLLILIALSGIALVIQRQKGIRRFFKPIEKEGFAQYYHVVFGRFSLFFILAIALTGSYLSLSRFVIQPQKPNPAVDIDAIQTEPARKHADFVVFRQTLLSKVKTIQFPFSDFPEDYFTVKLKDRTICVNQFTGDVLAEANYSKTYRLSEWSLRWHTGRSGIVWSALLAIACGYIIFFIYSGFLITWKRLSGKAKNRYKAEESHIVILVGSENGSTFRFAGAVYKQLLKQGHKAYITDLNSYTFFPAAEHLIIMTSTYGEGDPPSNAGRFAARLARYPQAQRVRYSVVGFGSRSYQQFCGYAYAVQALMKQQSWADEVMDIVSVNDKSPQDFSVWVSGWTERTGFQLLMPRELLAPHNRQLRRLKLVHTTDTDEDGAFIIRFKERGAARAVSGDLVAIYPKNDHRERLYSIGKVNGEIQLSVKLHTHGLGSGYLHRLQPGASIRARILKNKHFRLPGKAKHLLMIANGTGIAPFLGMIHENRRKIPAYLYCGFRTQQSFALYEEQLSDMIASGKLLEYHLALSREGNKQYVNHLLQRDGVFIARLLTVGGVIMICGSLSMQKDVMAALEEVCRAGKLKSAAEYLAKGQILTDCY